MTFVFLLLTFFSISSNRHECFNQRELEYEMSCDTYPFGVNASPMVKTISNKYPIIDSFNDDGLFGTFNGIHYVWDSLGNCKCGNKKMNLTWGESYYNRPIKSTIDVSPTFKFKRNKR